MMRRQALGADSMPRVVPAITRERSRQLASCVYEGWVRHRRYAPHAHAFRYRICMLYIDLAELDEIFAGRRFWSRDERNLGEFRRSDYLGNAEMSLDASVRSRVREVLGAAPRGPIRMLAHLRYFGHVFNPVAFYYCFAADGITLETIVAEITNTPWKERHSYVLPVAAATRHRSAFAWNFAKAFHVSPFMPMERDYAWHFTAPSSALRVNMDVLKGDVCEFDATLVLRRRELDGANMARVLWRFPLMTLRIVWAIHWQALRLYLRRNPIHVHPKYRKD